MDSLLVVHPSTLAIPTLEPIPQSVAPTPSLRESPPNEDVAAGPSGSGSSNRHALPSPSDFAGSSRRSSVSSTYPIPGSYFPASGSSRRYYSASSGTNTPSERPRPSPINIPDSTPDEPLFSAYPDTGTTSNSKGKAKAFHLPLKSGFNLSNASLSRRRRGEEAEESSADEWRFPLSTPSSSRYPQPHYLHQPHHSHHHGTDHPPRSPPKSRHTRKRANTVSSSSNTAVSTRHRKSASTSAVEDEKRSQSSSKTLRLASVPRPKTLGGFRRRRASTASAAIQVEYEPPGSTNTWKNMPEEVAQKFDSPPLPFSYQQPARSDYTLQSVSTATTARPINPSIIEQEGSGEIIPVIAPRRSSLSGMEPPILLGLTNISRTLPEGSVDIVIPEDMVMPHDPPPRRSSLDPEEPIFVEIKSKANPEITASAQAIVVDDLDQSALSASLTNTDTSTATTSNSAAAFSPSNSSQEHPLSSATTSLSRSAKSGKEGVEIDGEGKEMTLSAVRLQRSLEWEARQAKLKRRLEKRIMIILELAETEVAYTEDLRTLCHVYLPQLAALPSVTERSAKMIARNTEELLVFHATFVDKIVDILKGEGLNYDSAKEVECGDAGKIDRISKSLATLFVDDISQFSLYKDFCAESIIATTLVKHISERVDYEGFEKRCQIIGAAQPSITLRDLLDETGAHKTHSRSRLHFKDYLITPIQRICRYPLLLSQLLDAAGQKAPESESEYSEEGYDVEVDLERALGAMRGVAEEADEARRLKDAEVKSATVLERLEPHSNLAPSFIRSLGTCRLIGSLDVLHHHPVLAPLAPPVKVKYLAAFLYRGYLILAKVKKGKSYEAKHFLPLEVFELIDITEGFLPHSIRLTLRDHNFDLAASCDTEKEVWASAICQARDESIIPPFELPASVSPFPVRARRSSTAFSGDFDALTASPTALKRHTLIGAPSELDDFASTTDQPVTIAVNSSKPSTPLLSPIKTTFGLTPERKSSSNGTILLRRASNNQRILVERGLGDLFSDSLSTTRFQAQLQQRTLFLPDLPHSPRSGKIRARTRSSDLDALSSKDSSTMLRRRKSFLDHRGRNESIDIAITGEVKGSVIELRPSRSYGGHARHRTAPSAIRRRTGSISSSRGAGGTAENSDEENEENDTASATATATAMSDFGGGRYNRPHQQSRNNSYDSLGSMITPRRSVSSFRASGSGSGSGNTPEDETIMIGSKHNQGKSQSQSQTQSQRLPYIAPRSKSYQPEGIYLQQVRKSKSRPNLKLSSMPLPYGFRARSTPVSPILSPTHEIPPVPVSVPAHVTIPPRQTSVSAQVPPPPPVQKSKSDESPRKHLYRDTDPTETTNTGMTMPEYFIPPPHGSPLDSIGNNIPLSSTSSTSINRPETSGSASTSRVDLDKPLGALGTLRRSMSFLPLRRGNSITSFTDFGGSYAHPSSKMESSGSNSNSNSNSGSGSASASASALGSGEGSEESHIPPGNRNQGYLSRNRSMVSTTETEQSRYGDEQKYGYEYEGSSRDHDGSGNGQGIRGGWSSVPNTPKRKKSLRLFGLKGFTPM
ncbi:uncharacterized protein I303_100077 [Kwoniella dejecticola CBS 10117]|uniref:DH domain-containing protein n=1 Tax=Kwoniella dejecticola CBS 10117 TaxID=1296121 RepID=A0A1A6ADW8_9TREE|nr:uncharacterized protein I303_00077 [Kwoniella dejecticola CBS 10117]OBR88266.1 hypothetical protein I303_00077 [Kwoniella dejecticola CBS 10117]